MNKNTLISFAVGAMIAGTATSARAQLFNVDVNYGGGRPVYNGSGAVIADTGVYTAFTTIDGGASDVALEDTAGATPGVTISDTFGHDFSSGGGNPSDLENYYQYGNSPSQTITLKNLTIGDTFSLVVYADGILSDGGQILTLAGGLGGNTGSTLTTDGTRDVSTGIGGAYNTFTGTVGPSGNLALTLTLNSSDREDFNGLQLLESVPEPSTWALLALGLGTLVLGASRRSRTLPKATPIDFS